MKEKKDKITFREAFKEESDRRKRYEESKQILEGSDDIFKNIIRNLHEKHPNLSPNQIIEMAKEEMTIIEKENLSIIKAAVDEEDKMTR